MYNLSNRFGISARPNHTAELVGGIGMLTLGFIHSVAFPEAKPETREKPAKTAVAEIEPEQGWKVLTAPAFERPKLSDVQNP